LAEADNTGTITRYYIYGAGLLALVEANNNYYAYHFDGTGHTTALTDSNQIIVNSYAYAPYGKLMAEVESIPQPYKYAGLVGIQHEGNELYYMRARYYDAEIGRFISEDPAGFVDGPNLYAYVGGNPIMLVDPTGKTGLPGFIGGFAVGFVSGGIGAYATGGSSLDVVIGAFTGGAVGGVVGAVNPGALVAQAGNLVRTLTGAAVGSGSNIAGQSAAIGINPNLDSTDFSPGSVIFNGFLGGAAGTLNPVGGAAAQIGGNAVFDTLRGPVYNQLSPTRCGVKCGG
ncbi:MAG: RHS repeat-associated core domain-containing protein, partial [Pseudomonadota bacterium]|nr:RHS repeat-associated core domain-containing protein [Pseudomonadota bacterium]